MILKETNNLLREIRDELREINKRASTPAPSPEEMMKKMGGEGGIADMMKNIMKGVHDGG